MRILQICHKSPFPPAEGGPMAMKAIRDGLSEAGHCVHTFALSTPKFKIDKEFASGVNDFSFSFVDTTVKFLPALFNLCLNKSYHISRFYKRRIFQEISNILKESAYDAILVESIFMMPYFKQIKKIFNGPVVLRGHNIEHIIWERIAGNEKNFLKKIYLKILAKQLKHYEVKCFSVVDAIASISDVDTEIIKNICPGSKVQTIPFAIKSRSDVIIKNIFSARFGHIGSMDWIPNLEGINWFMEQVWPEIIKENPDAEFYLAGRNMPIDLVSNSDLNLFVEGEVESAEDFMKQLDALVVPLLSGSGVRIKIAEALSLGVPVITTPVGCEGLKVTNEKDIIVCKDAKDMVEKIRKVIQEPETLYNIAREAVKTISQHHEPQKITKLLVDLLENKQL
jgi:glycosyltransferase involved in cell wall biosynthesis